MTDPRHIRSIGSAIPEITAGIAVMTDHELMEQMTLELRVANVQLKILSGCVTGCQNFFGGLLFAGIFLVFLWLFMQDVFKHNELHGTNLTGIEYLTGLNLTGLFL